jgi:hypothetical protein
MTDNHLTGKYRIFTGRTSSIQNIFAEIFPTNSPAFYKLPQI